MTGRQSDCSWHADFQARMEVLEMADEEPDNSPPIPWEEEFVIEVQVMTTQDRDDERELIANHLLQSPGVIGVHIDGRTWCP